MSQERAEALRVEVEHLRARVAELESALTERRNAPPWEPLGSGARMLIAILSFVAVVASFGALADCSESWRDPSPPTGAF